MTDNRNNDRRGPRKPGGGRSSDRPSSGNRPSSGDKPFRKREEGERTFRPRTEGDSRPPRRDGDKPFRKREEGERTFRPRSDAPATAPAAKERDDGAQRIAKVMARAGLCSRRDAEQWIEAGRVSVNGETLTSPAFNVTPEDVVLVDGKPMAQAERTRLFLFHKPRGCVTTDRDPEGRATIFDALPDGLPRVVTVGRLDINTEGLLLLTNDGGLARMLELPSTGWLRRYRVRAKGATNQAVLDELSKGVTIDGIDYAGIEARLDREQGANVWLTMGLREGKNREVKRVLEHIGLEVNRLIRISFGPFQLLELDEGAVEEVPTRILRDQLGPTLAAEAGVDFDGPVGRADRGSGAERAPREDRQERPPRRDAGWSRAPEPVEEEQKPRQDRPKPGPRKHISVIRAERRAEAAEGRKRIERGETADRKGRAVKIERVVAPAGKERPDTRNGRRFSQERGEPDGRTRTERPAGSRFPRSEKPREDREDFRGPRPDRKNKSNRFGGQGERPRGEGRPARDDDRPRSYAARSSQAPRGDRDGAPRGRSAEGGAGRPSRGDKPFSRKPGGSDKPRSRGPGGPKPGGRPGRGRD